MTTIKSATVETLSCRLKYRCWLKEYRNSIVSYSTKPTSTLDRFMWLVWQKDRQTDRRMDAIAMSIACVRLTTRANDNKLNNLPSTHSRILALSRDYNAFGNEFHFRIFVVRLRCGIVGLTIVPECGSVDSVQSWILSTSMCRSYQCDKMTKNVTRRKNAKKFIIIYSLKIVYDYSWTPRALVVQLMHT